MTKMLAIDPGLQGTGLALFLAPTVRPVAVTVLKRQTVGQWWDRALLLAEQAVTWASAEARRHGPAAVGVVLCEFPQYQASPGRAMGWRTGDLQRLTFLTGVLAAGFPDAQFQPVVPSAWKGQLPKTVVEMRIRERLGDTTCARLGIQTHAWDAVGLGLWGLDHWDAWDD